MPKYKVTLWYQNSVNVEIEAATADEAGALAEENFVGDGDVTDLEVSELIS